MQKKRIHIENVRQDGTPVCLEHHYIQSGGVDKQQAASRRATIIRGSSGESENGDLTSEL